MRARRTRLTRTTLCLRGISGYRACRQHVGRLPQGMDLVLGYAYLKSEVVSRSSSQPRLGIQLANVPKQTFNAFLTRNLFAHVKRRRWAELRGEPNGEFDGAIYAADLWSATRIRSETGRRDRAIRCSRPA